MNANLAKTVEMPAVLLRQCRSHYTELEVAVLCYLADAVTDPAPTDHRAAVVRPHTTSELQACNLAARCFRRALAPTGSFCSPS